MAEETEKKASDSSPAEGVVVSEAKTGEKAPPVVAAKVTEEETKKPTEEAPAAVAVGKETSEAAAPAPAAAADAEALIQQSVSFKEESNLVGDLPEPEKKALDELKQLVQAALSNNEFNPPPPPPPPPPPKSEEPSASEAKVEEPAAAEQTSAAQEKAEVAAPAEHKVEETAAPTSEEPAVAPSDAPKVVESVEIKTVVVDDDGAKTVEAIEETVVPVTPPAPAAEAVAPVAETETDKESSKGPEAAAAAAASVEAPLAVPPAEEFIWGVPLVGDEKSDTVLLKFLRARDFKVKDALAMIKNAVIWRKQFGIESLLEEDLAVPELAKVVFYHGQDKEGHPVCYNVYGEFQDPELYSKAFGDEEKREKFLRWRIQFLEKGIRQQLDFSPKGVCTMVQITDLRNVPGPGKKELRQATKKALALLQDNYPEFVAKQVFINVPWWYLAYNRVISPFFTQRSKSKFVFAGPSKSAETIFRYIAPEHVPVQYGGLSKENDPDFISSDAVTEVIIKPSSKHVIELPSTEPSLIVWELRVLGWDVSYSAEFVPTSEEGYTVLVQKARKFSVADEPYVKSSFKVGEPGKIVLSIDNATTKKKKLLYRSKTKSNTESA